MEAVVQEQGNASNYKEIAVINYMNKLEGKSADSVSEEEKMVKTKRVKMVRIQKMKIHKIMKTLKVKNKQIVRKILKLKRKIHLI